MKADDFEEAWRKGQPRATFQSLEQAVDLHINVAGADATRTLR